jgi:GxxExxY protein
MELNKLTEIVIGCAIEVHRNLGLGLLESAYQECLIYELKTYGLYVEREIKLPIIYKEIRIDHGYRIDLLIENRLVI